MRYSLLLSPRDSSPHGPFEPGTFRTSLRNMIALLRKASSALAGWKPNIAPSLIEREPIWMRRVRAWRLWIAICFAAVWMLTGCAVKSNPPLQEISRPAPPVTRTEAHSVNWQRKASDYWTKVETYFGSVRAIMTIEPPK